MGADFLWVMCPYPSLMPDEERMTKEEQKEVLQHRVDAISDQDLSDIEDQCCGCGECSPEEIRNVIKDSINVLYEFRRDTGDMHLGGQDYILTGGMSYGDPPTDAYHDLNWIVASDITSRVLRRNELEGVEFNFE